VLVTAFIVVFAVGIAVVTTVLAGALAKRQLQIMPGVSLRQLGAFSREAQTLVTDYLRTNYSGSPEQLPGLLPALLAQVDEKARAQGLNFDRPVLKMVVRQAILSSGLAKGREVMSALAQVA